MYGLGRGGLPATG